MDNHAGQPDAQKRLDLTYKVVDSRTINEIKVNTVSFIEFAESNKKYKRVMCGKLMNLVYQCVFPYLSPPLFLDKNVNIISPSFGPVFLLSTCVPQTGTASEVISGLRVFLERCGEYIDPIEAPIADFEINMVLDAAQRKFRLLDIIARQKPLKILRLENSHIIRNAECGISEHDAIIMVYHPRDVAKCDRVFIFAHELGHAFHKALTGDVDVIPDGFDEFNKMLGIEHQTLEQKQEAFADVTAFAVLGSGELKTHLPHPFSDYMSGWFEKFIRQLAYNQLGL